MEFNLDTEVNAFRKRSCSYLLVNEIGRIPQTKIFFLFSLQAQVIAQAIGQAFGVAYQQFLQENGMKATDLKPGDYSDYLESQELYNGDLAHFSDSQNIREVS